LRYQVIAVVACPYALVACSAGGVPTCSSKAPDVVAFLIEEDMAANWYGENRSRGLSLDWLRPALEARENWDVVDISEVGASGNRRNCAATAILKLPDHRPLHFPIRYDISYLEDKKTYDVRVSINLRTWKQ
jgi:hypothetical protein